MSLSKSYAQALFESCDSQKLSLSSAGEQLKVFLGALESKELLKVLTTPVIREEEKEKVVEAFSEKNQFHPLITRFLSILSQNQRMGLLENVILQFEKLKAEKDGSVVGEVESAVSISEEELAEIEKEFSKKLGKSVKFTFKKNQALLAGLKVTVEGVTYDGTLRSQLNQLREKLIYET